ncbi:hypothetical protein OHB26_33245 [Nocardia sp. NBC_01503]|uniref:hypothetical protein n=1 Tax=Nocardia sp. NBC_01503 TaxID=2975997 RepID=UPI002E7BB9EC|nr:hypothetical protein [Nocardia sp. NBC_01503]WTL31720.1 hypothetical protein OHB26_33245 [Nocardia sp. NBC_01503]
MGEGVRGGAGFVPAGRNDGRESKSRAPEFGAVGYLSGVGTAFAIESFAVLRSPLAAYLILFLPLLLIMLPWSRAQAVALGALAGWLTVPLGALTALVVLGIVGVGAMRSRSRRTVDGGPEPVDPWVVGAVGMPVAGLACLLLTWWLNGPLTPAVRDHGGFELNAKAVLVASAAVVLALLVGSLCLAPRVTGSTGPSRVVLWQRGIALAVLAGALLTPLAWHIGANQFYDRYRYPHHHHCCAGG